MSGAIRTVAELEALYGPVSAPSSLKVADHVHPIYRPFIEAAPLVALATAGSGSLDVTPRGDRGGVVRIQDELTLLLPDRKGNNRIDSLRNIVVNPRVALLFIIPGIGETLRVNGRAEILADPPLLASFAVDGRSPPTVLRITVAEVFIHCSRALSRARLWDPASQLPRRALPSTGAVLHALGADIDADGYDQSLAARVEHTLY